MNQIDTVVSLVFKTGYRCSESFRRLRDNSAHLHECSPFWVGIFIIIVLRKLQCLLVDSDMRILIGKVMKKWFMVYDRPILC